jgi:PAS domain-containing protein
MNSKFSPLSVIWFRRSLPLLFLGLVVGIESGATYFFGHQTLAPLLSILSLSILAFYCSPRLLLLSTPLFMLLSYLLIQEHSPYPLVRTFTVLLGGVLAVWLGSSREKLQLQQDEIETILSFMPLPWLLADSSGNILRISSALQKFLDPSRANLINSSFFSLFSAAQNRGEFIRLFLDTADNSVTHPGLNLTLANPPHTRFIASLSSLPSPSGHSVLIILNPCSS